MDDTDVVTTAQLEVIPSILFLLHIITGNRLNLRRLSAEEFDADPLIHWISLCILYQLLDSFYFSFAKLFRMQLQISNSRGQLMISLSN
jgi:hypothetical protein